MSTDEIQYLTIRENTATLHSPISHKKICKSHRITRILTVHMPCISQITLNLTVSHRWLQPWFFSFDDVFQPAQRLRPTTLGSDYDYLFHFVKNFIHQTIDVYAWLSLMTMTDIITKCFLEQIKITKKLVTFSLFPIFKLKFYLFFYYLSYLR